TREFYAEARKKLGPGGVLSFVLTGPENYISGTFARFLASIVGTLREVFPEVAAIPGTSTVVLASDRPLSIDPAFLAARISSLGLKTTYVSAAMLPFRLDPARIDQLASALRSAALKGTKINRDLVPASYYFQSLLWAGQFGGLQAGLLQAAGQVPSFWFLEAPLLAAALALALLGWGLRGRDSRFLVPVAIMGFTSIVVEVALLIAFQANFGYVYGKIPLLLAAFMAGLVLGAALGRRRKRPGRADLPLVQLGFVLLLLITYGALPGRGGEPTPFALLALFGTLSGYLFIIANTLVQRDTAHPGLGYGVDLIASFAGAVFASALIIPLFGIPALILRLAALNALTFIFLLFTSSR
ncbi:MAG TPA: hypothetical protein VLJ16_12920, partial [Acidobacteriota bacterium]|nr:hypothetical protein [Acidobacteriota bacterium]